MLKSKYIFWAICLLACFALGVYTIKFLADQVEYKKQFEISKKEEQKRKAEYAASQVWVVLEKSDIIYQSSGTRAVINFILENKNQPQERIELTGKAWPGGDYCYNLLDNKMIVKGDIIKFVKYEEPVNHCGEHWASYTEIVVNK